MKILFLSGRETAYSRNRIILEILKQNNDVKVCTTNHKSYLLRIITTYISFLYNNLFYRSDLVFIGFLGQPFVPFVKPFTRKKLILDAYLSMYNTLVEDRKTIKNPLLKKLVWHYERFACRLSDMVLLDTDAHIEYFKQNYTLNILRFKRLFIGVDNDVFKRTETYHEENADLGFNVYFHGNFIPLQGAEYIIGAANILKSDKSIHFYLIGDGLTFPKCNALAKQLQLDNISFLGRRPFSEIPALLAKAQIGLGIFGDTSKTKLVVPNKVYELAALGLPIITADTPAIREVFKDREDISLCTAANPESLAKSILALKKDSALRAKLAKCAYSKCMSTFSKEALSKVLNDYLKSI
jgi:glycosyltransferase involved in cell wall biosynthesis